MFYWGKTLGYLWSLRYLVTGRTNWPRILAPTLSISFGLKTAVLADPSDLKADRPSQNSKNFFLYKTHTCFAKKNIPSNFAFFDQLWSRIYPIWRLISDVLEHCCKFSQDFESFIRSPFWIDFYFFAWKLHLNISILQLWRAYQSRCDQVWEWLRKLTLRFTKWYINHVDCMHQSGNIACQSWSIIAKYFQTAVLAEPSDHNSGRPGNLTIFSLQNPTPLRGLMKKSWPPIPSQSKSNTCDIIFF